MALSLYPCLAFVLHLLDVKIDEIFAFTILTLFTGWLFLVLDDPIYKLLEGLRFWPKRLRSFGVERQERQLQELLRTHEAVKNKDKRRAAALSTEIRRFPLDENGNFKARHPTRLGNLMAAYEQYPRRVYGMSGVFYWPRLWLHLDDKERQSLDLSQAFADSTVFTTVALAIAGLLSLGYSAAAGFFALFGQGANADLQHVFTVFLGPWYVLLGLGLIAPITSCILYRLTLDTHEKFGALFKSVFDSHCKDIDMSDVIEEVQRLTGDKSLESATDQEKHVVAWRYLQNYRINTTAGQKKPPELPNWTDPYDYKCKVAGQDAPENC